MIEVYFRDENKHHWHEIVRLAKSDSHESFELLRKYVLEGYVWASSIQINGFN